MLNVIFFVYNEYFAVLETLNRLISALLKNVLKSPNYTIDKTVFILLKISRIYFTV